LLRRGIPYRLVGSVRFYERREVKDAVAYLRLVANPRDGSAFQRVVNVPRRKIGDKTVAEVLKLSRSLNMGPLDVCEGQEIAAAVNMPVSSLHVMKEDLYRRVLAKTELKDIR